MSKPFRFKHFTIYQQRGAMKVNTDGVLLGAWTAFKSEKSILDIGTGTGVIALMAAQRCISAAVTAVEIDKQAYEDAVINIAESPYRDRVQVFFNSIQVFAQTSNVLFEHIVTNPPYFTAGTQAENKERAQARHTAALSFQELLDAVLQLLAPSGKFSLILPFEEGSYFQQLALESGLYLVRKTVVYKAVGKLGRLLMTYSKVKSKALVSETTLLIRTAHGDYSPEYKQLTKDFYLAF